MIKLKLDNFFDDSVNLNTNEENGRMNGCAGCIMADNDGNIVLSLENVGGRSTDEIRKNVNDFVEKMLKDVCSNNDDTCSEAHDTCNEKHDTCSEAHDTCNEKHNDDKYFNDIMEEIKHYFDKRMEEMERDFNHEIREIKKYF